MTDEGSTSQKVELFSPEWIALARRRLEEQVLEAGAVLDGVKFEICEVATDPPAHLAKSGTNRVAWHIVFDGASVRVGEGEVDCAFKNEVDYRAILPIARTVYSENPEVLATRAEERARSGLPELPAPLQPILLDLHDFLARRTA